MEAYLAHIAPDGREQTVLEHLTGTAELAEKFGASFDGEEQTVEILCENSLAGVMIDRFGKEVRMSRVDDEHFKVAVKVAASKHFVHWVMALGSGAKIIGPENLVHEVNEEIKRLAEQYRENLSNK